MSPASGNSPTGKVLVSLLYQLIIVLDAGLPGDPQRAKLGPMPQPCEKAENMVPGVR